MRVLLIDACPVLNADGTPVLREDGSPLYQLRNLHLSAALIARLKGEGYACVLFRLGDAALLIWLDELDDDDHIFTLGPILPGEATAGEEEAFGALAPLTEPAPRLGAHRRRGRGAVRSRLPARRDLRIARRDPGRYSAVCLR